MAAGFGTSNEARKYQVMIPVLLVLPPRSRSVASSPSPKPSCGTPDFQSAGTTKPGSFHVGPGSARVVE